jgi:hypothetical protein
MRSAGIQPENAKSENKKGPIFPGLAMAASTGGAALSGLTKTIGALPGGIDEQERQEIEESLTKERNVLGLGRSRPAGIDEQGQTKSLGGQVKDVIGAGLETGSFLAPGAIGGALKGGATLGAKTLGTAGAGALGGGLGAAGGSMAAGDTLGETLKRTATGAAAGGALGAVIPGLGAIARKAPSVARGGASLMRKGIETAGEVPGVIKGAATRFGQAVPETVSNILQNIAEGARSAAQRSQLAPTVRRAVSTGIPEEMATGLQRATPDDLRFIKEMAETAAQKKPIKEVAAKPALERFDFIRKQTSEIGEKMDDAIDSMMLKQNNVPNPRQDMMQTLADEGIQFNANGKIINTGQFTPSEASLLKKIVAELPQGDLLTPRQVVDAQRKLSGMLREASKVKGISTDRLQAVSGQLKNLLTQNLSDEYRQLAQEYAIIKNAMDDFLKFIGVTKKNGAFYTFDDIVEKGGQRTGERLLRLLSNTAGQATETMQQLDEVARQFGYQGTEDVKNIVEWSNLLEQIYDIVPKTSLQGRVEGAMSDIPVQGATLGAMGLQALKKAAGATRANQRKAFEELLKSIAP